MKVDKLNVEKFGTREGMGLAAAAKVAARITELLEEQEAVNMIFAAAPSQNEFLAALRRYPVEWSRVRAFHMDEYTGLPSDAPQGFGNFLRARIFGELDFLAVHYIDGGASDLTKECERYAALLRQFPTDIVCMGIGENGHIAFNDPPVADFNDPLLVKAVELDQPCRRQQVNDGCFASIAAVPTHAITLTVPALMAGNYVYCMVPGPLKADAVRATLLGPVETSCPASILRTHAHATLFLDEASASKIG